MSSHYFEQRKTGQPEIIEEEATDSKLELSRRKFIALGFAGATAALLSGKTKEAAAYLEKATNEELEGPKIEIEIFYSAHATRKDIEGLAEKIKECDVFVPEAFGENKALLDILSNISEGKRSPQEFTHRQDTKPAGTGEEFEPFSLAVDKAIYNTHKLINIFDVPTGHLLYDRIEHVSKSGIPLTVPFERLITIRKRQQQEFANLNMEREQLMLRRLMHFKKELAKGAIPRLRGKDTVKILIFLGAAHTRIYHELKKRGENVSRKFPQMPYTMGPNTEPLRSFFFGKEPSDNTMAKDLLGVILDVILRGHFSEISADTQLKTRFLQKVVGRFEFKEIKNIFDAIREGGGLSQEEALGIIRLIAQKGITIPESEEEMKKTVGYK